jgi:hypothetical protein
MRILLECCADDRSVRDRNQGFPATPSGLQADNRFFNTKHLVEPVHYFSLSSQSATLRGQMSRNIACWKFPLTSTGAWLCAIPYSLLQIE